MPDQREFVQVAQLRPASGVSLVEPEVVWVFVALAKVLGHVGCKLGLLPFWAAPEMSLALHVVQLDPVDLEVFRRGNLGSVLELLACNVVWLQT